MVKVGVSFGDFISLEKPRKRNFFQDPKNSSRDFFLVALAALFVSFLIVKLISLQLIEGERYRFLSDSNRIRTVVIHAPRGIILDRSKNPLVFNIPGFREVKDGKVKLLSQNDALNLLALGKNLDFDSFRKYPYGDIFAHILGYIGQISQDELRQDRFSSYSGGDLIGKMGLEQYYESTLRGVDGKQLVEVDSKGKAVRTLGQTDPIPGENITTTLDLNLQQAVFSAMSGVKKGAAIVSTPKGEVLSLVSKPSFDPNLFTLPSSLLATKSAKAELNSVLYDAQGKPLLDRAISGTYPPGSTFKLIVATSGLENNIIDENWQVEDTGIINIGVFSFSNWYFTGYGRTEGMVNVVKGIKRSNDIFFYKLAEKVGVDTISKTAQKFGLGSPLGIDLEGEEGGLVPTTSWKEATLNDPWFLGDTYHYGIGQGYLSVTPLQVNGWTQAIANGGILYQPHLLGDKSPKVLSQNLLNEKNFSLIREGMIESCSTGGVAWPLFEFRVKNEKLKIDGKNFLSVPEATSSSQFKDYRKVTLACKTGTAQHGGPTTEPDAWITLFAPAYNPQIVVTVLSEDSGEGSNVAGPIAKKILDYWFSR